MKRSVVPALAAVALVLVACDDSGPYLFQAEQYEPGQDCVDDYAVIDNLDGTDPGALCSPVCLTNLGVYYVTSECAPYPHGFVLQEGVDSGLDPICVAALAAFARTDLCVDGGPPLNPLDASPDSAPADASAPMDAASVDASAVDSSSVDASMGDATTD